MIHKERKTGRERKRYRKSHTHTSKRVHARVINIAKSNR